MEITEIRNFVETKQAVLLYFFNDNCMPCKVLRPKIQKLVEDEFPEMHFQLINSEAFPATAAEYGIFSSPAILVFFEAKEYIRESKNISISELYDKIQRIYTMIF